MAATRLWVSLIAIVLVATMLITIMLGWLKMTVNDCIEAYISLLDGFSRRTDSMS